MRPAGEASRPTTPISELGLRVARAGEGVLRGEAEVGAEMYVPGSTTLRASILAIWADVLSGLLVVDLVRPRVPVTLQLDVDLFGRSTGIERAVGTSSLLKAGSAVSVVEIDFTDGNGRRFATSVGTFMVAPDPGVQLPEGFDPLAQMGVARDRLTEPFADRAGCVRLPPNEASISMSDGARNSSGTLNGGLLALAAEEAALTAMPGSFVESLSLHYLRPVRVGPAVATAEPHGHVVEVAVRDHGRDDRPVAVHVIARTAPIEG